MQLLIVTGNVGKAPELRTTQSGKTVCSFSVADTEKRNGQDYTTWFKINAWEKLADVCNRYVTKGMKICVVGKVSANSYEGKDGKTYTNLEVYAEKVEFLSKQEIKQDNRLDYDEMQENALPELDEADNDLPF